MPPNSPASSRSAAAAHSSSVASSSAPGDVSTATRTVGVIERKVFADCHCTAARASPLLLLLRLFRPPSSCWLVVLIPVDDADGGQFVTASGEAEWLRHCTGASCGFS